MAKRNTIFKNFEEQVGQWFGVHRNPLSGRNNRSDDGKRRLGDILYKNALVEVKTRRKLSTITRALESMELAEKNGKPFIHFERIVGDKKVIATVCHEDLVVKFVKLVDLIFRDEKFAEEILLLIEQRLKELRENEKK